MRLAATQPSRAVPFFTACMTLPRADTLGAALADRPVHTYLGREARVVGIADGAVVVVGHRGDEGARVLLADLQAGLDQLDVAGEVAVTIAALGPWARYVAAMLVEVAGVTWGDAPARVILSRATRSRADRSCAYLRARVRRLRVLATARPAKRPTRARPTNPATKPSRLSDSPIGAAESPALGTTDALSAPARLRASPPVAACTAALEREGAVAPLPFLGALGRAAPARREPADRDERGFPATVPELCPRRGSWATPPVTPDAPRGSRPDSLCAGSDGPASADARPADGVAAPIVQAHRADRTATGE